MRPTRLLSMVLLGAVVLSACSSDPSDPGGTPTPSAVLGFSGTAYAQVRDTAPPTPVDLGSTGWTAEVWVKPEAGGDRRQFLMGQWGDPGAASWALELERCPFSASSCPDSGGYVIAETHDGMNSLRVTDSVRLSLHTWHHVAFAYQNGSGTVYVDGKAIAASNQLPLPMTEVQPVRFGAQAPSGGYDYGSMYMLTGELTEARLWSVARTAEQIAGGRSTRLHGNEAGLLAYWPLNDGAGDPKDVVHSVVAYRGGPSHTASQQPSWVQDALPFSGGSTGYVLGFNGSEYAQLPWTPQLALDLGSEAWTAEAWVKPDSGGGRRQFLLGQWGDPGAASWALELERCPYLASSCPAGGYVIGETHDGINSLRLTDSVHLSLHTWHHVAFSYQRGRGTVYVDGRAIASSAQLPIPMTGVQPVRFGDQAASGGFFTGATYPLTGRLAEVRFWSVARTAQQIASGRFERLKGNEAGLLSYWPLNDGSGDPRDLVHGLVASLGGPAHASGQEPAWVQDAPPVR